MNVLLYFGFILYTICELNNCAAAKNVTTTTTAKPITTKPTTEKPITIKPTTAKPTTAKPITTTAKPTTTKPTTVKPTTAKPTTTKHTTAKPTTTKPTTAKPTKPVVIDPIANEEAKILKFKKEVVDLKVQIHLGDKKCNDEIQKYEKQFNIADSNYSKELEIQKEKILQQSNITKQIIFEEDVLKNVNYNITKEKFINYLLVTDLNVLIKRNVRGEYARCKNYSGKPHAKKNVLKMRSFFPAKFQENKRARLARLQVVSKQLGYDIGYLRQQLVFSTNLCEEEIKVISIPTQSMKTTVAQLMNNTKLIEKRNINLKKIHKAVLEKIANGRNALKAIKAYNDLIRKYYKNYMDEENCFKHLKNVPKK